MVRPLSKWLEWTTRRRQTLAVRLREVLQDEAIISRLVIRGELHIWGIDDSVTVRDVASVIVDLGGCAPTDIKTGLINKMKNGLGPVWVQCPLAVAIKVAPYGRIRIGWSTARVELMRTRPQLCFQCWQAGHTKIKCKAEIDRSRACFRCGQEGHTARECTAALLCVLCKQAGHSANLRMGSASCTVLVVL